MRLASASSFSTLVEVYSTSRRDGDGDTVYRSDHTDMHSAKTLAIALLAGQSAWAALFPRSGPVKDLQAKDFKKELGDGVSRFLVVVQSVC